ncbi:MAG: ATP-dependent Clp protease adaptor ClpS [Myxococcaceae bacterium]
MAGKVEPESDVETATVVEKKVKKPPLYKVLLHNDNYTTQEFVVAVLKEVFHRSDTDSHRIMLQVHHEGVGVAGVYTYDVADTKIRLTEALAQQEEFPLRLSMEPEEV